MIKKIVYVWIIDFLGSYIDLSDIYIHYPKKIVYIEILEIFMQILGDGCIHYFKENCIYGESYYFYVGMQILGDGYIYPFKENCIQQDF